MIKGRAIKGNTLVITTDDNEFKYPIDKFKDFKELKREVERKEADMASKEAKESVRRGLLLSELDRHIGENNAR